MDFNNNKKSFEELIREKVEHHEFPFEAGSWAQMQSKLQTHQAQAAAHQSTLYKSILVKTGKVLVGVISASSIVYSTLSLSGVLDKKEKTANNNKPQQEIVLQKETEQAVANTGNTAMLSLADENAHTSENTPAENAVTSKYSSADSDMRKVEQVSRKESITAQNATKANKANIAIAGSAANNKVSENSGKKLANESAIEASGNNKQQKNTDINSAVQPENTYIAAEKNASENKETVADKESLVKESATQKDALNAPVTETKENVLAADAEADSAMALNNNTFGGKYAAKPSVEKPKSKISLLLSAGLNSTWHSSKEGNYSTLDIMMLPMVGVHAAMPVKDRVAVQAGAQYASYDVKNVSHTSAIVQYAILQDSSVTRTNITKCKYVELPLVVKYAAHSRFNFYTGLRTSLLIGANATVSQEQYVNKRLASTTPVENGDKFAQYNGLRTVNFAIPFGVEYVAGKRFSLSAAYNLGLTDFTIDKVFENTQKDKLSSVQLQVNYKLF